MAITPQADDYDRRRLSQARGSEFSRNSGRTIHARIGALEGPAVTSFRFDPDRPMGERWGSTETSEHGFAAIRASFRTQIEAERALATLVPLGKNENAQ